MRLAEKLEPLLKETGQEKLFHEVEMPLMDILTDMEWSGVRIDPAFLGASRRRWREARGAGENDLHAGRRPLQRRLPQAARRGPLRAAQAAAGKKTKTGWSTDVEVLTKLAEEQPIAARLLEYRSLAKLKGTYSDALPRLIHPETGRIHTSFNQAVTATGRLSSSDPNLQNIPIRSEEGGRIREAFIPAEGNLLLSADYSQVELRILAHMADEAALKEAFERGRTSTGAPPARSSASSPRWSPPRCAARPRPSTSGSSTA